MASDIRPSSWNPSPVSGTHRSLTQWARVVADLAHSAVTVDEALEWTLSLVCEHTGWPIGHVFLRDEGSGSMISSDIWADSDPERHRPLVEASRGLIIKPGQTLPGLILDVGDAVWLECMQQQSDLLRGEAAARSGLVAATGYPVIGSRQIEGIMEFFLYEPAPPEPELADLMFLIGAHLGGVIERSRSESALAHSENRFRSLIEQAPDAVFALDLCGRIQVVNAEAERLTGFKRRELLGSSIDKLVPDEIRIRHESYRDAYGAEPRRRPMGAGRDLTLRRSDSTTVPVDISLSPIDEAGSGLVVAVVRDLTERRLADEAVRQSEARLAEAQRIAHIGSWSWEPATDELIWSAEMRRIYGLVGGDGPVDDSDVTLLVHPEDRALLAENLQRTLDTLEPFDDEYRVVLPTGDVRWLHSRGYVTEQRDGRAVRLGGFCQDITDQKRTEEGRRLAADELADHHRTLQRIARGEPLETILNGICSDVEKRYPEALCSVLLVDDEDRNLRHAAAPSLPAEFTRAMDGLPVARGLGACGTAAAIGETVVVDDIMASPLMEAFSAVAERFRLASVWSMPLKNSGSAVVGTIALYRRSRHEPDTRERALVAAAGNLAALAIERHLNEKALALAAQVDPLTQLPNRARFLQEVALRLASRRDDITVMFLDLDRFKWINDSLGHPSGDRILVEAANRLRAVVSGRNMVARFGGDEFTVMLVNASPARVLATAERVEQAFAEPFELDGGEFFLTVSIGISSSGDDAYAMIRDADAAMYEAKDRGRARHVWFDERLRDRAVERLRAESSLRRAIERAEFVVHYQPIADMARGRWSGVEALARWNHPSGQLVGPGDFIPLAEETGLILPLGSRILQATLAEAESLGVTRDGLTVAVNLSALQLSDPTLAEAVGGLLDSYGVPPSCLVLELTESALMEDYDNALGALRDITALGVSVVIDDFGTGYSSISRLNELPVSGIKIDRSFTARIGHDPTVDAVLGAIVDLAHALGLTVVAEGIETPRALELLQALGCDGGQGYYLGRPAPHPQAQSILRDSLPILG